VDEAPRIRAGTAACLPLVFPLERTTRQINAIAASAPGEQARRRKLEERWSEQVPRWSAPSQRETRVGSIFEEKSNAPCLTRLRLAFPPRMRGPTDGAKMRWQWPRMELVPLLLLQFDVSLLAGLDWVAAMFSPAC
jgi:hypothetical protein